MLHYEDFEAAVMELTGDEFRKWQHILPAIPLGHRFRYIRALEKDISPPMAFDYVMCSLSIKDDEFIAFLQQALISKVKYTESDPCVFADALLISAS